MSNVAKLPTAATSYYTVRKAGMFWDVVLVTPMPRRNLRTALYRHADRERAMEHGRHIAAEMHRPFKGRAKA